MSWLKLGSLFDGSGGFPLAGSMHGITPIWASEIEPFPIRVTKLRFPNMKHLGSVTDINGAEVEPVDIITFGSPCQDLSVAGKQAGIHDGQRSNLFFEAVRIIKEMRNHDRETGRADLDLRPRFAVWENVPGAFSSNKGADFRAVLQALCEIQGGETVSVPMPEKGKWNPAGCVVGDGWSIAWRVYDAQFWGVPQRRKRIYLIADFASERAGEILFESEGVSGDPKQGGEAREGTADDAEGSAGGSDRAVGIDGYNTQATGNKSITIRAGKSDQDHVGCVCIPNKDNVKCLNQWDIQSARQVDANGSCFSLQAHEGGRYEGVCYSAGESAERNDNVKCMNPLDCQSKRQYCIDGAYRTFDAWNSAGGQAHGICYEHVAGCSYGSGVDLYNGCLTGDVSKTLNSIASDSDHVHVYVERIDPVIYPKSMGSTETRSNPKQGDPSPTLTTDAPNIVCAVASSCVNAETTDGSISPTLLNRAGTGGNQLPLIVYPIDQHQQDARFKLLPENSACPTLSAKMGTGGNNTPMVLEERNE